MSANGSGYDDQKEPLENVAKALFEIASALRALGTGNAASQMGALEFVAAKVGDAIADAGACIADAIRDGAEGEDGGDVGGCDGL